MANEKIPNHTLQPYLLEKSLAKTRRKSKSVERIFRNSKNLLVNIGCGDNGRTGWVNLDVAPYPSVNCIYDCRLKLPFRDRSVRGIFSEHFFEHLNYADEAPIFLGECRRVLIKGGVLRIVVPDFELYLRAYVSGGWDKLAKIRPLKGRVDFWYGSHWNTQMELLNQVFRQSGDHKFAYDFETLKFILHSSGFNKVKRQKFGRSSNPEICLDHELRRHESLYVEATK